MLLGGKPQVPSLLFRDCLEPRTNQDPGHDPEHTETVRKTCVRRIWVGQVPHSKLLDSSKTLERCRIYDIPLETIEFDIPVDVIDDDPRTV